MKIKVGDLCLSKEAWLLCEESDLNQLQFQVVQILQQWDGKESVFYLTTSGSSGEPKEIALSRELLIWSATNTRNYLNLKNEKIGCCLPLDKAGGFMMLIRSLIYNCDIHIVEPVADPMPLLDADCSFVSLVPYQLIQILKNETSHAKFNNIQKVLLGGAEIPHGLLQPIIGLKRKVYYGYGMTETASHIALTEIHDTNEGFDVLPGVEIQIGQEGIIVISIPAFNLQISTHDIGKMENNKLVVLGRKEHYINSGGVKIHANELEGIISKVLEGRVKDISFVVLGLPHPVLGEAISVITEKKAIASEMHNVINEEIVLKLGAKFKVLNWSCVDEFPRVNQKIDKRQLKATIDERVKGR